MKNGIRLIGKWVLRIVGATLTILVLSVIGIMVAARNPTLIGPNRRFFQNCTSIKPGMTLAETRIKMSAYLELGRNYIPDASQAPFYQATIMGVSENNMEHCNRIIFIPGKNDSADWCIVYPEGEMIKRVEISPD